MSVEQRDWLVELLTKLIWTLAEQTKSEFDIVSDCEQLLILIDIDSILAEISDFLLLNVGRMHFGEAPVPVFHDEEVVGEEKVNVG